MLELQQRAAQMLQQQFGTEPKWLQINDIIWGYFQAHPGTRLTLSEIDDRASSAGLSTEDFLPVLALLERNSQPYLRLIFYRDNGEEVPCDEFMDKLRAWWREKTVSDSEWKDWASQVLMAWEIV